MRTFGVTIMRKSLDSKHETPVACFAEETQREAQEGACSLLRFFGDGYRAAFWRSCEACLGHGRLPKHKRKPCVACGGVGRIEEASP